MNTTRPELSDYVELAGIYFRKISRARHEIALWGYECEVPLDDFIETCKNSRDEITTAMNNAVSEHMKRFRL